MNKQFDIPNRLVNAENPMLMSFDLKLSCVIKNAVDWSRLVNLISKYSYINIVLYLSCNTIPPQRPKFYSNKKGVSVYSINDTKWCNMIQISKGCLNKVIIISLQEVIKRPLKGNIPVI